MIRSAYGVRVAIIGWVEISSQQQLKAYTADLLPTPTPAKHPRQVSNYCKRLDKNEGFPYHARRTERWPSGRRRSPAKGVYPNRYRGFESLSLRHIKKPARHRLAGFFIWRRERDRDPSQVRQNAWSILNRREAPVG